MTEIYFSDYFSLSPEIMEEHGAFDVSLINDLPLFVDPFLLFNSENEAYQQLHNRIINYMRFLKEVSLAGEVPIPLLKEWFTFPEVKQNWLGFSRAGNEGRGLGMDFATVLHRNLNHVFRDFGDEVVTRSSHIEKLCLIRDGVGRDNISDFTTNLIKDYLANYTQDFALRYLDASQRRHVALRKVRFNYDTRSWITESFELPYLNFKLPYPHDDFILLTPKDILTKDEAWINRPELLDRFPEIANALPDATLRAQVNDYLVRTIPRGPKVKRKEVREAIGRAVEHFPQVLDYYIRNKEDSGDQAVSYAKARVREAENIFINQVRLLVSQFLDPGGFYFLPYNTHEEARQRVIFLKDIIENKGGHKLFYVNGAPLKREADLQILYRLTWYATSSDVTREANDGRGPADFKVSRGVTDKTIVEFKLAKNTQLERNLEKQCKIYEAASDTTHPSIKVILYFDDVEYNKVHRILKRLNLEDDRNIVLIDACDYNKPSGSYA
ncbi:MAG: hypothetical protein D4R67_10645 [Bacteroidetes bacterium]|nr:MAG: hypothetical protein D4R67_10645 [Bacteroidota bacterium]